MPSAIDWLTNKDKSTVSSIVLAYDHEKIVLELDTGKNLKIEYEKFQDLTSVKFQKEAMVVDQNFVSVFLEDFKLLVQNQTKVLINFFISFVVNGRNEKDPESLRTVSSEIFDFLIYHLRVKRLKLQVKYAQFSIISCMDPIVGIVRNLDPKTLEVCLFHFYQPESLNIAEIFPLIGRSHLELEFHIFYKFNSIFRDNMDVLKTILMNPTSFKGLIFYLETFENLDSLQKLATENDWKFETGPFGDFGTRYISIMSKIENGKENGTKMETSPENSGACSEVFHNSVIMESILAGLEFFDVQRLRKTSTGIRNCIDHLHSDPKFETYSIELKFSKDVAFYETITLQNGASKSIKTLDFSNFPIVSKNFETNLKSQKCPLAELQLKFHYHEYDEFSQKLSKKYDRPKESDLLYLDFMTSQSLLILRNKLSNRKTPLKVEKLTMTRVTEEDVMQILPFLDSQLLRRIEIVDTERELGIEKISKTEQWSKAEQLVLKCRGVTTGIQKMNLFGFSLVDVVVKDISSEDVGYLKTELLRSLVFNKFKITFSSINDTPQSLIGEPYRTLSNCKMVWYFRMPNPDYYLHIVLDTHDILNKHGTPKAKVIAFAKVAKEDTPFYV